MTAPYPATTFAVSGGLGMKRISGIGTRLRRNEIPSVAPSGRGSDLAVVPEIDHRVGEGLECVVQPANAFESQLWPAELVLPR
jgi:hypothetical protein